MSKELEALEELAQSLRRFTRQAVINWLLLFVVIVVVMVWNYFQSEHLKALDARIQLLERGR